MTINQPRISTMYKNLDDMYKNLDSVSNANRAFIPVVKAFRKLHACSNPEELLASVEEIVHKISALPQNSQTDVAEKKLANQLLITLMTAEMSRLQYESTLTTATLGRKQ